MGIVDLGRAFPVPHGNWADNGGTGTGGAYERLSIVRHLGKTWISAAETTEEPTNGAADWDLMVEDTNEFVKPVIDTVSIGSITGTSAVVTVNLQKFGLVVAPNVGVEYREVGATTWSRTATQTPTAIGSIEVNVSGLALGTDYEVRAFAIDPKNPDILSVGEVLTFSTTSAYIAMPTVSVSGYPDNISTTPTLTTSAFSAVGATDSHFGTTWRARDSNGDIVWESPENTIDKTSITVPSGYLRPNTAYTFEAIHIGSTLGNSATGTLTAITANTLEVEYLLVGGGGTTAFGGNVWHGGASGGECIAGTVPVPLFATNNVVIGGANSISTALGITARSGIGAAQSYPANTPWLYGKGGQGSGDDSASPGQDGFQWVNGVWYGGGGGASSPYGHSLGGRGGGGSGGNNGGNGAVNTGGGGGGGTGNGYTSGYGGSGIFIARYAGTAIRATGGTITTSGGYTYHTFIASGTFKVTG